MKEYAELSQLKKPEMSQNDPSKIELGKLATKKCCKERKEDATTSVDITK